MGRKRAGGVRLEAALLGIEQLDVEGLRRQWQALYGVQAPATFRLPLLRAGVAYKLQERAMGGLKPATRTLLRRIAEQADGTRRAGKRQKSGPAGDVADSGTSAASPCSPSTGRAPESAEPAVASRRAATRVKPGTRLLRSWQGRTHEVVVFDGGVIYRGQRHRSLSEVARLITGQRWSGPLFFGVKRRASSAPKLKSVPATGART